MTTYNVAVPVVALVDADSPEAAIRALVSTIDAAGLDVYEGTIDVPGGDAFVSDTDTEGRPT